MSRAPLRGDLEPATWGGRKTVCGFDFFSRYTALRCNVSLGALRPEGDLHSHEKLNKQRTRYIEASSRGAEHQQIRTTAERWHESEHQNQIPHGAHEELSEIILRGLCGSVTVTFIFWGGIAPSITVSRSVENRIKPEVQSAYAGYRVVANMLNATKVLPCGILDLKIFVTVQIIGTNAIFSDEKGGE